MAARLATLTALLVGAPRLAFAAGPAATGPSAFMARAMALRDEAVAAGDQPFGAVVVLDARIIGEAASAVLRRGDANAHAEREALAAAARDRDSLAGAELYSSSRPCPLCEAAAWRAGIVRMVHGSALVDAGPPRPPRE